MIEISIIIPTLNDEDTLESCLDSLVDQTYSRDKYEIIIVDGGSSDGTVDIAEQNDCTVLFESEGTISYAREVGIREASGKYISFTDADCVVTADWLERLHSLLEQQDHTVAGIGGPNVTPEDDTPFAKAVGEFFRLFSKVGARYGYSNDELTEVEHNPTCNAIYRKDVLEEVGGFNKDLVTVDDEEMDFRIRDRGYKLLFCPDAIVNHYRRPTWNRFVKMAYRYGFGRSQAIRLHRELGKWFHYAPTVTGMIFMTLIIATFFTSLPPIAPIFVLCIGEIGIMAISVYMWGKCGKSGKSPITYALLINSWLFFWAIGFARGFFNSPNSMNRSGNLSGT